MRRLWMTLSVFAVGCCAATTMHPYKPALTESIDSVSVVAPSKHIIQNLLWVEEMGALPISDSLVRAVLTELRVEHPHIVHAQMRLESGHYASRLAQANNNFFGMKQPAQRFTVSLGSKNGYASYRNWVYSIIDYTLWQQRYAAALTEDEYLAYLAKVYASDKHYVSKITSIANTLKES